MSESASPAVQIPLDILQQLGPLAEQMGISLPGVARFAPTIDVTQNIRALALEIGRLVAPRNIFIKSSGFVVTVDAESGDERLMTPARFVGWIEEFCSFKSSGRSNRLRDSLSREDAATILDQDIFKHCLRPLNAIHKVRLPVRAEDGKVEFLPAGYDEQSAIYTIDTLPYDMEMPIGEACQFLMDVCCEFPWNGLEEQEDRDLRKNRSFAVHVLAMLGTYCRAMFPLGTLRPMIAYFANKPGSGKTRMAEMALAPVYGFVAGTGVPKDEEKMDVKLETIARAMKPWVIFDDVGGMLRSNSLNRFLTETNHSGRCYGSNSEFFEAPNVTQFFVTANEIPTSDDLTRRALAVEFFLDVDVRGRKFKRVITPHWLAAPETRKQFLGAFCSIVKNWLKEWELAGEPFLHPTPLETFDDYTSVMGGIVVAAGFADPLARPEMDVGGASQEDEIKQLLIAAATARDEDCTITREELVTLAREKNLIEDLVGMVGDPALDATMNKRFGRRMQKWRGQKMVDDRKPQRLFRFGHKRKKTGVSYPLEFIKS